MLNQAYRLPEVATTLAGKTGGIYDTKIENTLAVHTLEHGAVWIAYNAKLPAEKVKALREIVRGKSYTLMAPYPNLVGDVVMSAWSCQLVIDSFPDDRVEDFVNRYRQQGPQSLEQHVLAELEPLFNKGI